MELLGDRVDDRGPDAATDADRPMTLVTLAIPPAPTFLGLFPDYALEGRIAEKLAWLRSLDREAGGQ